MVILGSPVWAQKMASPVRSYILREKNNIKNLALFCTLGGAGGEAVLAGMETLSGRPRIASLQVTDADFKASAWRRMTDDFARQIREAQPQASNAAA